MPSPFQMDSWPLVTPVINIPGLGGSGPKHWQSQWEKLYPQCRRVENCDWNIPDKHSWLDALDAAITACATPPLLVAHSLGCALLAHWALRHGTATVKGALMVAPADVDNRDTIPAEAACFGPMPLGVLPFPTAVVASTNDAYVELQRAQVFATAWGADFHNIGAAGHINADSHLDAWSSGWTLLQELLQSATSDTSACLIA